jgi:hypothetical protein
MQLVLKTECFVGVGCGNPFPLASVGYGKVALPRGKPVSAQAWGTGSVLPVQEPIPIGKRGLREGCLPVREPCSCTGMGYGKHASRTGTHSRWQAWATGRSPSVREPCFCTGVGYGKHASRTGTHSRWQAWATGRLPSRTGTLFLHRRGVWEGHPVWGFKIIKAEGGGVAGAACWATRKHCMPAGVPNGVRLSRLRPPAAVRPTATAHRRPPPPAVAPPAAAAGCVSGHPVNPLRELATG